MEYIGATFFTSRIYCCDMFPLHYILVRHVSPPGYIGATLTSLQLRPWNVYFPIFASKNLPSQFPVDTSRHRWVCHRLLWNSWHICKRHNLTPSALYIHQCNWHGSTHLHHTHQSCNLWGRLKLVWKLLNHSYQLWQELSHDVQGLHWCRW